LFSGQAQRIGPLFIGTARMQSTVYATVGRPSVCLSHPAAARRWDGFANVGPAARSCRSIAAWPAGRRSATAMPQHGAQQQMRAMPRCRLT